MDKRIKFNAKPGVDSILRVALQYAGREPIDGSISDIGLDEVSVRFDGVESPAIPVGEEANLTFTGQHLAGPVYAAAITNRRVEVGDGRLYSFWFKQPAELEIQLAPALRRIFDRRKTFRVEPNPTEPIKVLLEDPISQKTCEAKIFDISATGMALQIDLEGEAKLRGSDRLIANFVLGAAKEPMRVEVIVRYRQLIGREVHYGAEYDRDDMKNLGNKQNNIIQYVMMRQRQLLKGRS